MIPDWSLETADALELAFNPRLRIANFTDHVRGWSDASERARAELRYHADVPRLGKYPLPALLARKSRGGQGRTLPRAPAQSPAGLLPS